MPNFKVQLPKWAIPRWWLVAYKIPPPLGRDLVDLTQVPLDARFEQEVSAHIAAVIEEEKMPPAEIAPAILNLANDLMSGREMLIRTGDYIALQRYFRGGRSKA